MTRRLTVPAIALATLLTAVPTSGASAEQIRGTAGSDVLVGTQRSDVISGKGGNDKLRGRRGNDRLSGGSGRDSLVGQAGSDSLDGGGGRDHLSGGRQADRMSGGAGRDRLVGGAGNDSAHPGTGRDVVKLGGGRDRIFLEVDRSGDVVDCGPGRDTVVRIASADTRDRFTRCEVFERNLPATPDRTATAAGFVMAIAAVGDRTVVGGKFGRLGALARTNVGVLLPDGTVDPQFVANTNTNGTVEAVAVSTDGSTVFLGGTFTTVNGEARANLAAVDATTGAVLPGWSANTTGSSPTVHSLAVHGSRLYVGGRFTDIEGAGRSKFAAVDTTSGDVVPEFDPAPDGAVREVVVTPGGGTVFAGGGFTKLGGADRENRAGAVDTNGTALPFDPVVDDSTGVVTMALSEDGSRVFLSTQHYNRVAAYDWAKSNQPVWTVRGNGNTQAMAVSDAQVYLGGHYKRIHGLTRPYLSSVDVDNGKLTSWDTRCSGARMGVWALTIRGSRLHVGGGFEQFGGTSQRGYARFTGTP